MKNYKKLFGPLGVCAALVLIFTAIHCANGPEKPVGEMQVKTEGGDFAPMSFGAALATPDSIKITPSGDTIEYFHNTVTQSYSYPQVYSVIKAKGEVTPPPDTTNTLPTADAGPDKTVALPTNKVFLVGQAGDVDGSFTVQWSKVSGSGVIVNGTTLVNAAVEQLTAGATVIRLTVTGDKGEIVTDEMTITVNAAPPTGQTFPLSFTPEEVANRYGAGFEQWHDRNEIALGYTPADVYYRFVATRIATAQRGVYNWSFFDGLINQAKAKKQKFSFGIMTSYPEGTTNEGLINIDGGTAAYPAWLQSAMSGEWRINGSWVPNYNDPTYLAWILELNTAINAHLYETGNAGVISAIDIRSYGSWGEWHSANLSENFKVSQYPAGTFPTEASLRKIVDGYLQGFPNFQLVAMIAGYDCQRLDNTWNPPGIAYYLLTAKNNKGLIGWRRDQWGGNDTYPDDYLKNNNNVVNGLRLKDSIVLRYLRAPAMGEPPGWNANNYVDLMRQATDYKPTSIGNGNYGSLNTTSITNIKAVNRAIGYRLAPAAGSIQTGPGSVAVTITWQNKGLSPAYDDWQVVYDFVDAGGTVRRSAVSKFKPRLFMGSLAVKDVVSTTGLTGSYTIRLRVSEPYRGNMPVEVKRNTDNTINLLTLTL